MKQTKANWWAVFFGHHLIRYSITYDKRFSQRQVEALFDSDWKILEIRGYRCRKVKISWEE